MFFLKIQRIISENRLILTGLALVTTYVLFGISTLNHFLFTWLQAAYFSYQILFLLFIFIAFQYYLKRYMTLNKKSHSLIIFGIIAGFISSFLAWNISWISKPYGWERFLDLIKTIDGWVSQFLFPFLCLGWLFGGIMGAIIVLLLKGKERNCEVTIKK